MRNLKGKVLQDETILSSGAGDPAMDPVAFPSELPFDSQTRLKIWEIAEHFKCPVIGWCFDIAEQKEMLRKDGMSTKDKTDFEIHEMLVRSLGEENPLSQRIDSSLNRKYRKKIDELSSLEQEELMQRWKGLLNEGDVEGVLWVAVTKTDLSATAKRTLFGDLHMQMHMGARQIGQERRSHSREREKREILEENIREISQTNRRSKKETETLRNELVIASRLSETLQARNQELQKQLSTLCEDGLIAGLEKEKTDLQAEKDRLLKEVSAYEKELRRLENRNGKLLLKLKRQWQPLADRSGNPETKTTETEVVRAHDPASVLDLSEKCVLLVGGRPQMESLYRKLVEANKGIFEYHDGRMKAGAKELVGQVGRADLVLCCIDHISHTAALVIKKLCKKYRKPCQMLMNSSLNNIFLTLVEVHERSTTIGNRRSPPLPEVRGIGALE
jgi:hypothetical protein